MIGPRDIFMVGAEDPEEAPEESLSDPCTSQQSDTKEEHEERCVKLTVRIL